MRRGATLVELVVAMALATIVLGTAGASVMRQRRSAASQHARQRAESQIHAGVVIVAAALAGLSPAAGDLAEGQVSDTAVQLRAAMANGFACDSAIGQANIAAGDSGIAALSGIAAMPRAGDSLWWYGTSAGAWTARRISDVSPATTACPFAGLAAWPVLHIVIAGADTVPRGAPLRITRQVRYSVYKAGDGSSQLGLREWSEVLHGFAAPQPVAGPFVRVVGDGARTGFRYFSAGGAELPAPAGAVDLARVARMRITMLASDRTTGSLRGDSTDVAFPPAP